MGWYKPKIRKSDKYFSEYIRRRDGRCMYGFRCWSNMAPIVTDPLAWKQLDCSHWQKRRHEGTRFDPKNCDAACKKCHHFVENDPEGQKTLDAFKLKQLGQIEYNKVLIRKNTVTKRDDVAMEFYAKQLLKKLTTKV